MPYKHDCEKLNCKSKSGYKGKCEHGLPRDRNCSDCKRTVKGGVEIICKCGFASSPTGMFDHELECELSRSAINCFCGWKYKAIHNDRTPLEEHQKSCEKHQNAGQIKKQLNQTISNDNSQPSPNRRNSQQKKEGNSSPSPTKSNTALYIGLAIAGVALIGIVVYLVTRKGENK